MAACYAPLAAGLFFTGRDIKNPEEVGTGRGSDLRLRGGLGGVAEGRHNHIAAPMLRCNKARRNINAPASKIVRPAWPRA